MIAVFLISAQAATPSAVAPEEFRRKVEFQHMCISDAIMPDTGFRELGLLNVKRGENLPDFALVRSQKDKPALFEKGIVTAADGIKNDAGSRVTAILTGEREGRPAKLTVILTRKTGDGMGLDLLLTQDERVREYRCFRHLGQGQAK
jgi:hypothetical protein